MTTEPASMETTASDATTGAGSYQDFILQRELAEVYLLLDNLSGSANRDLRDKSEDAPKFEGCDDWIEAVCAIAWPPDKPQRAQAEDVARLIRVRDYLNRRAAQANGLTIAFTILVAGEGKTKAQEAEEKAWKEAEEARKQAKKATKRGAAPVESPPPAPARPQKTAAPTQAIRLRGWHGDNEPPSRVELADRAFPNLWKSARWAKRMLQVAPYLLIAWLVLTCVLSWNVADGNALLGQLAGAEADKATVENQINAQNGTAPPGSQAPGPLQAGPQTALVATTITAGPSAAATPAAIVVDYCQDRPKPSTGAPNTAPGFNSVTQLRLCNDLTQKTAARNAAVINLGNWSRSWAWLSWFNHGASGCSPLDGLGCAQAEAEQWASSLLGVLSGSVLPIFYGLLGAGAAVVRGLSAKVREWQLAPRDLQMSLIQLALGAVIGACIGLFVTPAGAAGGAAAQAGSAAASAQGILGPVHLSASALCFIAGFFVEGVFLALESLMRRVFNIADPSLKPPPPLR